ncbi:FkbM family methyltransferase [Spiribacter sp. 1M153]|uniref:FkbM family methyltransferase n=1 Tax=Spiribacter roseus TaxID=1855875 RepID=UPI00349F8F2F
MMDGTSVKADLRSQTEFFVYFTGCYALDRILELEYFLKSCQTSSNEGVVFLDVGANIGFYSVAISAVRIKACRKDIQVFAFEPVHSNFKRLADNVGRSGLSAGVVCLPFGLSDQEQECLITLREDFASGAQTGNAALKSSVDRDAGFETEGVCLKTLDQISPCLLSDNQKLRAVKIDIEGHEDAFLRGGRDTIARDRPLMLMEINRGYYNARGVELDDIFWSVLPTGYRLFGLRNGQWVELKRFSECCYMEDVYLKPEEMVVKFLDRQP